MGSLVVLKVFSDIHRQLYKSSKNGNHFTYQDELAQMRYQANLNLSLLGYTSSAYHLSTLTNQLENFNSSSHRQHETHHVKAQRLFQQVEETGSEINYRCVNCRQCKDCKNPNEVEAVSIKEEIEQKVINDSVTLDLTNNIITATLPFIHSPTLKLAANKDKALKVYIQQLRKLNKP